MEESMNDDLNIPHCIQHYGEGGLPAETGIVPEEEFLSKVHEGHRSPENIFDQMALSNTSSTSSAWMPR